MTRRTLLALLLVLVTLLPAGAAHAAADDKATVLARWTQPTASSTAAWNAARLDRGPWQSYGFDWSTDYCSASPDRPLGFDFSLACWRHDFGYRNYKDLGRYAENRSRIDDNFYADLKRICAKHHVTVRAVCYSLAWTYYQAVRIWGSVVGVQKADLQRAEKLMR